MGYWPLPKDQIRDKRYDWTSGSLDYAAVSHTNKASVSAGELWWIKKYTWTSSKLTRVQGPLQGNWDNRATLAWT